VPIFVQLLDALMWFYYLCRCWHKCWIEYVILKKRFTELLFFGYQVNCCFYVALFNQITSCADILFLTVDKIGLDERPYSLQWKLWLVLLMLLCGTGLDSVDPFPVLGAVTGILLQLVNTSSKARYTLEHGLANSADSSHKLYCYVCSFAGIRHSIGGELYFKN